MNTLTSVRSLLSISCLTAALGATVSVAAQEPAAAPPAPAPEPAPAAAPAPEATAPAEPAAAPTPEPAPPPADAAPPTDPAAAKPKPPPYSLPFQLRPVAAVSVVRSDTTFAFYENKATGNAGFTLASMLLASYKVTDSLAPMVRLGIVSNSPPDPPPGGTKIKSAVEFLNPVLGATYALKLTPELRLGLFLGLALPIGTGGGNKPKPEDSAALAAGRAARSALDNAMFAVNDFVVFPGVGFAYVGHGLTAQVEATVLQLTRVRGEDAQVDKSRTNFTAGVHVGYFFAPFISAAVELRHQRWLSTPDQIKKDTTETLRDNTTIEFGPRFHIKLGEKTWIRPAVGLILPLDNPLSDSKHKIVQLDVPFYF